MLSQSIEMKVILFIAMFAHYPLLCVWPPGLEQISAGRHFRDKPPVSYCIYNKFFLLWPWWHTDIIWLSNSKFHQSLKIIRRARRGRIDGNYLWIFSIFVHEVQVDKKRLDAQSDKKWIKTTLKVYKKKPEATLTKSERFTDCQIPSALALLKCCSSAGRTWQHSWSEAFLKYISPAEQKPYKMHTLLEC